MYCALMTYRYYSTFFPPKLNIRQYCEEARRKESSRSRVRQRVVLGFRMIRSMGNLRAKEAQKWRNANMLPEGSLPCREVTKAHKP